MATLALAAVGAAVGSSLLPAGIGILGATMKIALTEPAFFDRQGRAIHGEYTPEALQTIRDVYYSPETGTDDLIRFGRFFQSESRRAILDLTLLAMRMRLHRASLPVLVIGGQADALFPPAGLPWTINAAS